MTLAAGEAPLALLEIGLILLGMGLLARLSARVGMSPIPLFLLVGLLLGRGGLVPVATVSEFIEIGADIGVVVLLLLLGLEYTGRELTQSMREHWASGAVDAALNFTPGFVFGLALGFSFVTALFLGGVTYVSSSGIIAKLLSDLGRMGNRETPAILSILVTEDLVMALYLPVVTGLVAGGPPSETVRTIVLAILAVIVVLVIATRHGAGFTLLLLGRTRDPEIILLSVLGIALVVGAAGEYVNLSAAVAAFLIGLAISGDVARHARIVLAPIRDLFAAIFFVFFGLEIDPGEIPPVLALAGTLAVITAVTKYATGWYASRRMGVGPHGRRRAGSALIVRGEFSIVIAQLGIGAGLDATLGLLAATYVLILGIAGPIVARLADRRAPHVLRLGSHGS